MFISNYLPFYIYIHISYYLSMFFYPSIYHFRLCTPISIYSCQFIYDESAQFFSSFLPVRILPVCLACLCDIYFCPLLPVVSLPPVWLQRVITAAGLLLPRSSNPCITALYPGIFLLPDPFIARTHDTRTSHSVFF